MAAAMVALAGIVSARRACRLTGRSRAGHYRDHWRLHGPRAPRPAAANALSDAEVAELLALLRSPRFVDLAPAQVWAILLDENRYVASVSTMYRVLRAHGEIRERRRQATHPARTRPELVARAPNQVWSWDITKLRGPDRGVYYDCCTTKYSLSIDSTAVFDAPGPSASWLTIKRLGTRAGSGRALRS